MTQQDEEQDAKKAVYYDGSCPMCTSIINKIGDSSMGYKFSPRDIKTEPLPPNFSRQDVEREMHVVDGNGVIYKNAEAILKLLEEYPAWNLLVKIGRLPGVKHVL